MYRFAASPPFAAAHGLAALLLCVMASKLSHAIAPELSLAKLFRNATDYNVDGVDALPLTACVRFIGQLPDDMRGAHGDCLPGTAPLFLDMFACCVEHYGWSSDRTLGYSGSVGSGRRAVAAFTLAEVGGLLWYAFAKRLMVTHGVVLPPHFPRNLHSSDTPVLSDPPDVPPPPRTGGPP